MRNGSFHECRVCEECSQQFYGCGAAAERARIVAELRRWMNAGSPPYSLKQALDDLERDGSIKVTESKEKTK